MINLGKAIKLIRVNKGYSQEKFASLISITPSYLSLIESGKRNPNTKLLERISSNLNIPLSVLIFIATEKEDFKDINEDLYEKISTLALDLIKKSNDVKSNL